MDMDSYAVVSLEEIKKLLPMKTSSYPEYYPTEEDDPD